MVDTKKRTISGDRGAGVSMGDPQGMREFHKSETRYIFILPTTCRYMGSLAGGGGVKMRQ